jgi:UDP-N-acetylglucosamine--N-acetylmuramyl-(pentapeptide) pyrophosphoryl-undecaprenol N-acetylglucosamine transferase
VSRRTVLIAGGGTGGHLMPALAIAAAIRTSAPHLEPVLVGATRGVEARVLPTRDFRYHLLAAEPIYRRTWWRNIRWPVVGARLVLQTRRLLAAERPAAVIGTGGYASAPVVWLAARQGLPTAVQEQNAYPGLAVRWLARRARHVYLGLPEARGHLRPGPGTTVFETGNPIPVPDPSRRTAALARFGLGGSRPVVLVTGGSQGSLAINRAVAAWLDAGGGGDADVLWVTGRSTHGEFADRHRPPAVNVVDFLDPMADGYAVADVVLGRAGAITVAELCAWGLPSVLVPLPTAAADHQTHNARALAAAGAGILLPQAELSADRLQTVVGALLVSPSARAEIANRARRRGRPGAAAEIAAHVVTLVEAGPSFVVTDNVLH